MEQLKQAIRQMISISESEFLLFSEFFRIQTYKKNAILSKKDICANEIFFIYKGIIGVSILDQSGEEHTIHFALENQFISDYTSFILKEPSFHILKALETVEVVILPREAIEWGYKNLAEGEKLGRRVAEFYFIHFDNRIKNLYIRTPKERYDMMNTLFPNIHNRVSQRKIASYLGISSIHLSRLKKADSQKG